MGKTVIFIIIACVLIVVWSACVMAARADEQLREITYDKKEPEEEEEDMAITERTYITDKPRKQ